MSGESSIVDLVRTEDAYGPRTAPEIDSIGHQQDLRTGVDDRPDVVLGNGAGVNDLGRHGALQSLAHERAGAIVALEDIAHAQDDGSRTT